MSEPVNDEIELTKKIYEAMQVSYLSERHDAIKAIITSQTKKAVERELLRLEFTVDIASADGGIFSPQKYLEIRRKELEGK